jgi:OOP family OmpA-OmpF porin
VTARWLLPLALVAACAGAKVRSQTRTIDQLIKTARDNGALRCAPVELALAEVHNDVAKEQLSQGQYFRAKREAEVAEDNARRAIEKSPKDLCNPADAPPVEPAKPADFDKDGILDTDDDCPRVPEDKDGFEDTDGCPEDDNDADGINDKIDDCPLDPEDRDGTEDTDGCPDPDNDGDGIADRWTSAPDEPEDADGFADDDGCPDCDNDGDGVPECPQAIDQCPAEPAKTIDGCPPKYTMITVTEGQDRAVPDGLLRHPQGHDQAGQLPAARRGRPGAARQPDDHRPHRGPHRQPGLGQVQPEAVEEPGRLGPEVPDRPRHR